VRRRRGRTAAGPDPGSIPLAGAEAEIVRQPALPGVRVFDVAHPGDPREITNSLFEPRMDRDLREGVLPAEALTAEAPTAEALTAEALTAEAPTAGSPPESGGPDEAGGSFEIPRARGQEAEDRGS